MVARALLAALLVLASAAAVQAKEHSRFVTAQMRANAIANAQRLEWARAARDAAVADAERWAGLSDEQLWQMVPGQDLPRDIHVSQACGCPNCGKAIDKFGNYPWKVDVRGKPWKLECPNCGEVYPKNDFEAFYQTALDEQGWFRKHLGDRSLLFNTEHPDPKDPLHKVFVDDGFGMLDAEGNRYTVIAVYAWAGQWAQVRRALGALSRAYTLTGEQRYAHKTMVLLDRFADVYPSLYLDDLRKIGFSRSYAGPPYLGRLEDPGWENEVVWTVAHAYDYVFDGLAGDEELVRFCSAQADKHNLGDKSSPAAICRHVEDNTLTSMLNSYKDNNISGNTARLRNPVAAAIALDRGPETAKWLDYVFSPGYPMAPFGTSPIGNPIPYMLVEGADRDGMGGMCGGYGQFVSATLRDLVDVLRAYPEYKSDIVSEYPKLRQCFLIDARLNCLDAAQPPLGDSGYTGLWGRAGQVDTFVRGFKYYRDPRMAVLAAHYADGDASKYRLSEDIYEADPEALAGEITRAAGDTPFQLKCDHLGRYGLAILQTEEQAEGRALWMSYSRGLGHSHSDCLSIGLYAKNIDMLPDHGYPEYTGQLWPNRFAWTAHSVSHNMLLVNDTACPKSPGGRLDIFVVRPPLRLMEGSSATAYPGMETYRRLAALVDVSDTDGYVVDVVRARGGKNHRLIYNGPAQTATVSGLELVRQATGTFAGPDVDFAEFFDGPVSGYAGSGFMYLYDVERSARAVSTPCTIDWKAEDLRGRIAEGKEPHLRLHALTACDEIALASGDPPQNKPGNPRCLRYLLQSRIGENVQSQFVTVLEPYEKTQFIKAVRRLGIEHAANPESVAAVAVELVDGRTDVIISCEQPTPVKVEGGIELDGQFGLVRLENGTVSMMRLVGGTRLQAGDVVLTSPTAWYEGTVSAVDTADPADNRVTLVPAPPAGTVGDTIHFINDLPEDTSYEIKAVHADVLSTGDITLVRGFKDPWDFAAGYTYFTNPGERWRIAAAAEYDGQ